MRSVPLINFKKVVSMVVMLSLILSACGKNPARRDGGAPTNDKSARTESHNEDGISRPELGMGAFAMLGIGAGVGAAGVAVILIMRKFLFTKK